MLKQILSKLPRKAFKFDSPELNGSDTGSPTVTSPPSYRPDDVNFSSVEAGSPERFYSAVSPTSGGSVIEPSLSFNDVQSAEKMDLFVSKASLCCVTFDFSDPSKNCFEKDVKKHTLLELVEFVASGSMKFSEPAVITLCRMFAANLFRVFPPKHGACISGEYDDDDDDKLSFDPAWPHVQIVYDLLLKFIISSCLDVKIAKKHIDHYFIVRLLDLFDSEDSRERECVKTVLHKLYGKFMVHRPFIRKSMKNVFCQFVFETEKHNGIAELLEIFGSIVTGFVLPLKEEHRVFFWRVLVPLHKPNSLGLYFQQLCYCIMQFIEKEPKLAGTVISGLLRYWPITNSQKEVMFLNELEEILEAINMVEFQKVMASLFWRIGCCMNSFHFQVAEKALSLWNTDQIANLVSQNRHVIVPIVIAALGRNAETHWNQAVLNLTSNVRRMLAEMDEALFMSCCSAFKEEEARLYLAAERRRRNWDQLENTANLQPVHGSDVVPVTPPAPSIIC